MMTERRTKIDQDALQSSVPPKLMKLVYIVIVSSWIILNMAYYWYERGDDLASGYFAARILHKGEISKLYVYTDTCFAQQKDTLWQKMAFESDFTGHLHPYVQIPLYAYALQPLAVNMQFEHFKRLFLFLLLTAMIASIILALKLWAPELLHLTSFVILLLLFSLSEPFRYSMHLVQTHPLIIFFIILGIFLEQKKKPFIGGLFLSIAISIKLTPILILIYWLLVKKYRAVFGAISGVGVIVLSGILILGEKVHILYLQRLMQINSTTIIGLNNQSIRAFLVRNFMDYQEMFKWKMHTAPMAISAINIFISIFLFSLLVIKIYRDKQRNQFNEAIYISLVFIIQTICSPIAWTHYFVILFVPFVITYRYISKESSIGSKIFFWTLIILQLPPVAPFTFHYKKTLTGNQIVLFGLFSSLALFAYLFFVKVDNSGSQKKALP
jgi:hypothetical protein